MISNLMIRGQVIAGPALVYESVAAMQDDLAKGHRWSPELYPAPPKDGLVEGRDYKVVSGRLLVLVAAVVQYAKDHFNRGGWDVICEAWSDEHIANTIFYCRTPAGAIRRVSEIARIYSERQDDSLHADF